MWRLLSRKIDRGSLVSGRTIKAHKHLGVENCETCSIDIYKNSDISYTFIDRKHDSYLSKLLIKNGKGRKGGRGRGGGAPMELLNKPIDQNYCRIATKQTK